MVTITKLSKEHFANPFAKLEATLCSRAFVEHGLIDAEYTERAGLHAFRHSLATLLIVEQKVDPKTAQAILHHTDAGLTMNIYTHAQDPAKRAALEKFESRLVN